MQKLSEKQDTIPTTVRLTAKSAARLAALAARLDCSQGDVVRTALAVYAALLGLERR